MFDDVPVRVWLLIAIAAAAYAPAVYVYRYTAASPRRRDITAPPIDVSWRSGRQLAYSASILVALAALAIFIFTPAAERFARSPSFWPLLLAAFGVFALFTVAKSMSTGTIEPLVRGFNRTYERSAHPKRFWASAAWNTIMGALFLWGSIATIGSQARERCHNYDDKVTAQEQLSACNDVLAERDLSREERNDLYRARGIAYHNLRQTGKAIDDYNRAIDLDPNDSYALYNRGLLYVEGEQYSFAIDDFSRSLRLRSDNNDGYANRAEAYAATGAYPQAIADCTKVLESDPDHEKALVMRGMLYVWTHDVPRAERDFARLRMKNPASVPLIRGEALLSLQAEDLETARGKFREALDREPDDRWTLGMLAEVHDRLGQAAEAQALRRRLVELVRKHPGERG